MVQRSPNARFGQRALLALGGLLGLFHLVHLGWDLRTGAHTLVGLVVGAVCPLVAALLFLVVTGLLLRADLGRNHAEILLRWTLVGIVVVVAVIALTVVSLRAEGGSLAEWWPLLVDGATGGAIVGLLVGVYDARATRTAARLRDERRRAEWLSQRLQVLNRVLRHDLRNEVNVVQGYASLVAEGRGDARRYAAVIERKADQILRVSEKARHFERLLAENEEVTSINADLAAVVRERLDALRTAHPTAEVHADLPGEAVVAAVPLLDAMVDDLVENAVVHNPAPNPLVSVRVRVGANTVLLRVADDGPGIPGEELAVLRAGGETPLRHSSGLGLWFVQWVVAESGGRIEFDQRSVGSVVLVYLPRASGGDGPPAAGEPEDGASGIGVDSVAVTDPSPRI
jgi:signal transduction histidine kinase